MPEQKEKNPFEVLVELHRRLNVYCDEIAARCRNNGGYFGRSSWTPEDLRGRDAIRTEIWKHREVHGLDADCDQRAQERALEPAAETQYGPSTPSNTGNGTHTNGTS